MTLEALLVSSTGTLPRHRSPGGASGVWQLWTHLGVVCTHTGAGSVRGSAGHPSAHCTRRLPTAHGGCSRSPPLPRAARPGRHHGRATCPAGPADGPAPQHEPGGAEEVHVSAAPAVGAWPKASARLSTLHSHGGAPSAPSPCAPSPCAPASHVPQPPALLLSRPPTLTQNPAAGPAPGATATRRSASTTSAASAPSEPAAMRACCRAPGARPLPCCLQSRARWLRPEPAPPPTHLLTAAAPQRGVPAHQERLRGLPLRARRGRQARVGRAGRPQQGAHRVSARPLPFRAPHNAAHHTIQSGGVPPATLCLGVRR